METLRVSGDSGQNHLKGFLLMADQGDQMPEVGDDKSDPELRVIRYQYRGWDILSKVTQKDFLLTLEKDAVG